MTFTCAWHWFQCSFSAFCAIATKRACQLLSLCQSYCALPSHSSQYDLPQAPHQSWLTAPSAARTYLQEVIQPKLRPSIWACLPQSAPPSASMLTQHQRSRKRVELCWQSLLHWLNTFLALSLHLSLLLSLSSFVCALSPYSSTLEGMTHCQLNKLFTPLSVREQNEMLGVDSLRNHFTQGRLEKGCLWFVGREKKQWPLPLSLLILDTALACRVMLHKCFVLRL